MKLSLTFTPIHSDICELRWIRIHPKKPSRDEKGQGREAMRMKVIKRKRRYRWKCFLEVEVVVAAEDVMSEFKVDSTL